MNLALLKANAGGPLPPLPKMHHKLAENESWTKCILNLWYVKCFRALTWCMRYNVETFALGESYFEI